RSRHAAVREPPGSDTVAVRDVDVGEAEIALEGVAGSARKEPDILELVRRGVNAFHRAYAGSGGGVEQARMRALESAVAGLPVALELAVLLPAPEDVAWAIGREVQTELGHVRGVRDPRQRAHDLTIAVQPDEGDVRR